MSSSVSRGQIVNDALTLAGRSTELKSAANQWLNYSLRDIGLTFRFPELRKTGAVQGLALGSRTSPLPADLGAGMEKSGMFFGPDSKPMNEVSFEEFANSNGFQTQTGRPQRYIVNLESQTFQFDNVADQAYSFTPVYFKTPPMVPVDSSYDSQPVWLDNDVIAVAALMYWIYVFTEDAREEAQLHRVEMLLNRWKRETVKMGGTSRILPSPSRFKNQNFMRLGGFTGP